MTTYFSYGTSPQFVLPAHVLRKQAPLAQAPFNAAPTVGDGPYTFVSWHRGESLDVRGKSDVLARQAATVQTLDIRIAPDPSTNLLMLQSGALDWNLIAPAQHANRRAAIRTCVLRRADGRRRRRSFSIPAHAPLDDVRVRRAIAMSVDRDGISTKITLGKYPVTNMLQPQFSWAYDPRVREPQLRSRAAPMRSSIAPDGRAVATGCAGTTDKRFV